MNSIKFERGTKRVCQDCQARFYDLARTPVICPKCGAEFVEIVWPTPQNRRKTSKVWPGRSPEIEAAVEPEASDAASDDEEEEEIDGETEPEEDAEDAIE